jgi:hypothetical protein
MVMDLPHSERDEAGGGMTRRPGPRRAARRFWGLAITLAIAAAVVYAVFVLPGTSHPSGAG